MMFDARSIAIATGGRIVHEGASGPIGTDSRRVAGGSWFVALTGDRFDGHDYLPHAAAAGCAGAVVSREPAGWTRGLVVVDNTLVALQDLGRAARSRFHGPTVAITGSVPASGVALLQTGGAGSAEGVVAGLSQRGCTAASIWLVTAGSLTGYLVGAPSFVNAAFPVSISAGTPFIAVCR